MPASMRYCQFENALQVMQELKIRLEEGVEPESLSESEKQAAKQLFSLLKDLVEDYAPCTRG
ncbi:hypothetical protein HW932_20085 [Allochromatium humboldtianum]|uniref:Uncharacterized protein n=1 Tax=Allochromatium humboldtianum TaxID=504901 RepID=A0A850RKC0_9GAMM|nr:hypothetical protein [Allochromatium humboldtianum]NVZ11552.1 hypothetical protein [Allochromatium humboldtianum]